MASNIIVGTNSFITVAEAEKYMSLMIGGEKYTTMAEDLKEAYLATAYDYIILLKPVLLPDPSKPGEFLVPECLRKSQAEMTLHDVTSGISINYTGEPEIIKKLKVGSIAIEYVDPFEVASEQEAMTRYPRLVKDCLSNLGVDWGCGIRQCKIGRS